MIFQNYSKNKSLRGELIALTKGEHMELIITILITAIVCQSLHLVAILLHKPERPIGGVYIGKDAAEEYFKNLETVRYNAPKK